MKLPRTPDWKEGPLFFLDPQAGKTNTSSVPSNGLKSPCSGETPELSPLLPPGLEDGRCFATVMSPASPRDLIRPDCCNSKRILNQTERGQGTCVLPSSGPPLCAERCVPQIPVLNPHPPCGGVGRRGLWGVIRLDEVMRVGPSRMSFVPVHGSQKDSLPPSAVHVSTQPRSRLSGT